MAGGGASFPWRNHWCRRSLYLACGCIIGVSVINLHGIVKRAIAVVNPMTPARLRRSGGYTINEDGTQVPSYTDMDIMVQVQALSNDELKQVEGLNIQGNKNAVYLDGNWNGIIRVGAQGGDLIVFNNQVWLAIISLESWPDWTKLAVVQQMDRVQKS